MLVKKYNQLLQPKSIAVTGNGILLTAKFTLSEMLQPLCEVLAPLLIYN